MWCLFLILYLSFKFCNAAWVMSSFVEWFIFINSNPYFKGQLSSHRRTTCWELTSAASRTSKFGTCATTQTISISWDILTAHRPRNTGDTLETERVSWFNYWPGKICRRTPSLLIYTRSLWSRPHRPSYIMHVYWKRRGSLLVRKWTCAKGRQGTKPWGHSFSDRSRPYYRLTKRAVQRSPELPLSSSSHWTHQW